MDDIKIKQEVVEKIKSSTNILITVSKDPSVDALSSALGLALSLDKIEKYATAIYSGATPPAISFLEPEKTFESNTDSLRDFIIALNREKADHLRFKPDGDHVKIYITPYKTTITPEDLEFSQGDFNVELIIALGVSNQEHLDAALDNHGQILHDATVITMTVGDQPSSLGSIDWHDPQVSSLSEMVTGLVEALKDDKTKSLIDAPVATALLTGIVAETDRFSNAHTTSKVMTIAANLMAAGADQQLIAFKLQQTHEISGGAEANTTPTTTTEQTSSDEMSISHDAPVSDVPTETPAPEATTAITNAYAPESEGEVVSQPESQPVETEKTTPQEATAQPTDSPGPTRAYVAAPEPTSAYAPEASLEATAAPEGFPGTPEVAPGSTTVNEAPALDQTLVHDAYAADEPAVTPPEPAPVPAPADLGLPMPPPLPDFSAGATLPPPPILPVPPSTPPERLGDILAPDPEVAPTPAPVEEQSPQLPPEPPVTPPSSPPSPGQFQIPGQS